jgi:hypothetical protein
MDMDRWMDWCVTPHSRECCKNPVWLNGCQDGHIALVAMIKIHASVVGSSCGREAVRSCFLPSVIYCTLHCHLLFTARCTAICH